MSETSWMDALQAEYKSQKKAQRTDDILTFILDHWRFFAPRRSAVEAAIRSTDSETAARVDAVCDALGVPEYVYFKRSPVKDLAKAVLDFENSSLYGIFEKCANAQDDMEACVFVIAGRKTSLLLTNKQVDTDGLRSLHYVRSALGDIYIAKASEAPLMLPGLFTIGENNE